MASTDQPAGTYPVPKILTELIAKHGGSKTLAAKDAGLNQSHFGKMSLGRTRVTDAARTKIEIALKAGEARPTPPTRGGSRTKITYVDPPLLAQLIARFNGRRNRAAAAMGYSTPATMNRWATNIELFDDLARLRVQRALDGEPPPSDLGEDEPDEYKLGLVVGVFPAANFERALDAADAFNGKLIFKKSIRTEWLGVWKMQADKAKLFKKLMARDAMGISCP